MSTLIMLAFLVLVAWFTFDGYRNGIYCGLVRLASLVTIYAFAPPIGKACAPYFENVENVPAVVRPHFSTLVISLIMLVIGAVVGQIVKAKTMKVAKDASRQEKAEIKKARMWGLSMGTVFGIILGIILLVVFWNIGWVAEEVHLRQSGETDPSRVEDGLVRKVVQIKQGIESSPLGGIVKKVNPVGVDDYQMVRDVLSIANDPVMLQEFRQHPNVQQLLKNEKILGLLEDEEVRTLIHNRDYKALLRNEKLAALVTDEDILEQFKQAEITKVLEDLRKKNRPEE